MVPGDRTGTQIKAREPSEHAAMQGPWSEQFGHNLQIYPPLPSLWYSKAQPLVLDFAPNVPGVMSMNVHEELLASLNPSVVFAGVRLGSRRPRRRHGPVSGEMCPHQRWRGWGKWCV